MFEIKSEVSKYNEAVSKAIVSNLSQLHPCFKFEKCLRLFFVSLYLTLFFKFSERFPKKIIFQQCECTYGNLVIISLEIQIKFGKMCLRVEGVQFSQNAEKSILCPVKLVTHFLVTLFSDSSEICVMNSPSLLVLWHFLSRDELFLGGFSWLSLLTVANFIFLLALPIKNGKRFKQL